MAAAVALAMTSGKTGAAPMPTPENNRNDFYDVAIVGGGLSGLCVARGLAQRGLTYVVLEASDERFGGRLRNTRVNEIDLGAAWIWPKHGQHRVARLLDDLGIATFPQPGDPGNTRVVGGTAALISGILQGLDSERLKLGWRLESISMTEDDPFIVLTPSQKDQEQLNKPILARFAVMAAPPRKLTDGSIQFAPKLRSKRYEAMRRAHTWMAGVTKVVVHFSKPFWRQNPTGQDIANIGISAAGPAFQVYDASSFEDATVALTFFALAPSDLSSGSPVADQALAEACCQQLAATWQRYRVPFEFSNALIKGCRDSDTARVVAQRWPLEQHISDEAEPTTIHPHPRPLVALSREEWGGRLLFAGTESDQTYPGVIEGAIGSADRVLEALLDGRVAAAEEAGEEL